MTYRLTTNQIINLVAHYDDLLDAVETAPAHIALAAEERLEAFLKANPGIVNYDERGNWVGSVAHENGWTA